MRIRVSSSIENFREKLKRRTGLLEWRWNIFSSTIFFGCYTWFDVLRIFLHRGKKKVFWTGSDILQLTRWQAWCVRNVFHYCENGVERNALLEKGIYASTLPMIFTDFKSEECFVHTKKTHVYLTAHKGREEEYGVRAINERVYWRCPEVVFHIYGVDGESHDNVLFEGEVSEERFNREIHGFHAALRLNEFDGFAEITAKSILLGQYPISRISYLGLDSFKTETELIEKINTLRDKQFPNQERLVWAVRLENNLQTLCRF